jgi:hypothetical protein
MRRQRARESEQKHQFLRDRERLEQFHVRPLCKIKDIFYPFPVVLSANV